jgi:hypothetical protein
MRRNILFILVLAFSINSSFFLSISCAFEPDPPDNISFPRDKWFFLINNLDTKEKLTEATNLASEAKQHGLNGVVLSAYLDTITRWSDDRIGNLKTFKAHCDKIGLELIPMLFSAGYGGAVTGYNANLAEGIPFNDVPFIVENAVARPDQVNLNLIKNPGFEKLNGTGQPDGFNLLEKLNEIVFMDSNIKHGGKYSIRLENFTLNENGHARIAIPLNLKRRTEYEVSIWVKTENLKPNTCLRITPYKPDMSGSLAAVYSQKIPESTQDWSKYTFRFLSGDLPEIKLYFGTWGGKSGRVWLDDIQVVETAIAQDVLKRPGAPLVVKSLDRHMNFEEGIDFETYKGLQSLKFTTQPFELKLTPHSRIRQGEHLSVSGYSAARVVQSSGSYQTSVCMSQPELYKYWADQVDTLYPILKMNRAFFSMDEIRSGGSCETCKARNLTMAQILGDCVTRQMAILRSKDPKMMVYIWADMFDPKGNSRANYFKAASSYEDSWKYVPKDLIMACWMYEPRQKSLKFFSENGFETLGSPYYDKKSLDDTVGWYDELVKTKGAVGIMYTTWKNDFSFLTKFADYINQRSKGIPPSNSPR